MEFRTLRADEIEVRVGSVKQGKGISLLLYKDARCDMRILDEVVGAENWQRKHYECKGNLFCSVGIKTDAGWIWKDDCGTESNTEKEKGESSDSFKRACFNWGIGRELYTSPFIWIAGADTDELKYEKFSVADIEFNDHKEITKLVIVDKKGYEKFTYGLPKYKRTASNDPVPQIKAEIPLVCKKCSKEVKGIKVNGEIKTADEVANMTGGLCANCSRE